MYTSKNFQTKKALREAFDAGEVIRTFQPNGDLFERPQRNGKIYLEGPHYPQPHKWYASGEIVDGILLKLDDKPPKNQAGVRAHFTQGISNAAAAVIEATRCRMNSWCGRTDEHTVEFCVEFRSEASK